MNKSKKAFCELCLKLLKTSYVERQDENGMEFFTIQFGGNHFNIWPSLSVETAEGFKQFHSAEDLRQILINNKPV